ncbi:MAG: helix-turn-helix transcriptional regulator [Firmicutes bacterium]|nr:helix-turn-helix transcriptional regulator [Bacillota bacterium]MBR4075042.1 helix-turn-helix transcriptional regulator [Bacillota bacterium]
MKQPELGKRLKEARIAKKMTQSEVVGTFITRNMLSQIESGKAMPSVETLQYLAEVLGIAAQSLISASPSQQTSVTDTDQNPLVLLIRAKDALNHKEYHSVLSLCESFPSEFQDEAFALSALAACELAAQFLNDHHGAEAAKLAQKAMEDSKCGLYANELVHSRALLLFSQAALDTAHITE